MGALSFAILRIFTGFALVTASLAMDPLVAFFPGLYLGFAIFPLFPLSTSLFILLRIVKITLMLKLLFFSLFCLCVLSIPAGFKRLSCGFKIFKMDLDVPVNPNWEVFNDVNANTILSQPFKYLNRGAQSYVFESLDGQYVVKFFRFDRLKEKKEKKIKSLFSACKLAFSKAREETGLLFVHLNRTRDQLPLMHVTGPLGQKLNLQCDDYRFVIQKKANSFQDSILKADPELVRKRLDSFIAILQSRLDKGIRNSDPAVIRNFGFIGDKAVEIDFGNYSENSSSKQKEFDQYIKTLHAWLKENANEWVDYLELATHY